MLHLKASERTGNDEIWVLLKCQKPTQTTHWTAALTCRVEKGTAQVDYRSALSSFSWRRWLVKLLISIRRTRLLHLPSLNRTCVQMDPHLWLTHRDQNTKGQIQSSALVCRHTHAPAHKHKQAPKWKWTAAATIQRECFCVDGQVRWADFQSSL